MFLFMLDHPVVVVLVVIVLAAATAFLAWCAIRVLEEVETDLRRRRDESARLRRPRLTLSETPPVRPSGPFDWQSLPEYRRA